VNIGYSSKHARRRRRRYYRLYTRSERSEHRYYFAAQRHLMEGIGISYIEHQKVFGGWAWEGTAGGQCRRLLHCQRLRSQPCGCPRDEGCRRCGEVGSGRAVRLRHCPPSFLNCARSERSEHKQIWRAIARHRSSIMGVFSMLQGIAD